MSATTLRAVTTTAMPAWGRRSVIGFALLAGGIGGLALGARAGVPANEVELTHLLRAMAVLKLFFVAAAAGAILWRLQAPVAWPRLGAYALVCSAMAAGPGMIWYMAYLGPASLLLHGGVALSALLLWQDRTVATLLDQAIQRRRAVIRNRAA